jgi:hypothetical protein
MPRTQTDYDEYLERPYQDAERDAEREDGEELEPDGPDPDDLRDELRERHQLEREEEARHQRG